MLEKEVIDFEKSIVVGIVTQNQSEDKLNEYLDELEFLTFTAGGTVVKRFSQKMDKPNPKTFVGTGKLEEIKYYIKDNNITTVIFDDELTPSQSKNITKELDCKVLDSGRISTMSIPIASINRNVDALRTSKRRNWNAWSWRN
jgi:GTP-binding protein HflX